MTAPGRASHSCLKTRSPAPVPFQSSAPLVPSRKSRHESLGLRCAFALVTPKDDEVIDTSGTLDTACYSLLGLGELAAFRISLVWGSWGGRRRLRRQVPHKQAYVAFSPAI